MSIPHRIRAEVQKTGNIQRNKGGHRENPKTVVPAKGSGNNRSRIVRGPHPHAGEYTAEIQRLTNHGIFERQEQPDDFDRHANLKYKYGNRHFWARGYFVDTVGRNKKQIQEYIRNQLKEDELADQMSLKEYVDPFTGRENKKA